MARDKEPVLTMYDAHALTIIVDEKLFHRSYLQRSTQNISTKLIVPENFRDYRHIEWKEDYDISLRCISSSQIIQ